MRVCFCYFSKFIFGFTSSAHSFLLTSIYVPYTCNLYYQFESQLLSPIIANRILFVFFCSLDSHICTDRRELLEREFNIF